MDSHPYRGDFSSLTLGLLHLGHRMAQGRLSMMASILPHFQHRGERSWVACAAFLP